MKISNKWGEYKTVAVWNISRIIDPEVLQYSIKYTYMKKLKKN